MKYKVGDRVRIKNLDWYSRHTNGTEVDCGGVPFTSGMKRFCSRVMTISFVHADCYAMVEDLENYYTDEMIEGLVEEEEIEFTEEDKYWCDIMSESDPTTYVLPQGYQFKDENGNVINATKIVLEKKKKEYPKTYEECCKVLGVDPDNYLTIRNVYRYDGEEETTDYERDHLGKFDSLWELRICRDAYWKIAGEEMGLKGPWEPDWNTKELKYIIYYENDKLWFNDEISRNTTLAFPTEEMRDEFYENFKKEIEICKELL